MARVIFWPGMEEIFAYAVVYREGCWTHRVGVTALVARDPMGQQGEAQEVVQPPGPRVGIMPGQQGRGQQGRYFLRIYKTGIFNYPLCHCFPVETQLQRLSLEGRRDFFSNTIGIQPRPLLSPSLEHCCLFSHSQDTGVKQRRIGDMYMGLSEKSTHF